ncbi:IS1595 family transposase [Paenibacillus antri]|uniref:IS1595 family transposase n=1 Tax=Paenibacillus antri TaxID=2582848 RepID=A0A5R9GDG1_9BACL|nr:IS1595 family transposase [Paenibacillus antri]
MGLGIISYIDEFFHRRWPDGFVCPQCDHRAYYLIQTRKSPLYQCRLCRHQTSVTAGTIMDKSRTPLEKWAAAIDLLGSTNGINAKQLSAFIGVSHKVAWTMLRKFRGAIRELEAERRLAGTVHAGLRALAPKAIFTFLPHRHYRCERVVGVGAAVDSLGMPSELKINVVRTEDLYPGWKELTGQGKERIASEVASPGSTIQWLNDWRMERSPLRECFHEANRWLIRLFNGIGSAYLQSYLDEFCFRWNAAAKGGSLRDEWNRLCFRTQRTDRLPARSVA